MPFLALLSRIRTSRVGIVLFELSTAAFESDTVGGVAEGDGE